MRERRAARQDRAQAARFEQFDWRAITEGERERAVRVDQPVALENADRRRHGLEQRLEARRIERQRRCLRLRLGKRDRTRSRQHAAFERARDMLEGLAVPFDMVQAPLRSEVGHFGPK